MTDIQTDNTDNNKDNPQQRSPTIANPTVDVQDKQSHSQNSKHETNKGKQNSRSQSISIASIIINALLATGTFMLWYQATLQSDAARRAATLADSSVSISKISVIVAESSIAIVKRNTEFNERIAKMEIRPYIAFDGVSQSILKVGKLISVYVNFVNAGKTPAYSVHTFAKFKTGTGVYKHEFDSLEIRSREEEDPVCGAGQTKTQLLDSPKIFSSQDSIIIFNKAYRLFLYGRFTYVDKFGDMHFTNYCLSYDLRLNQWIPYTHYNDAD